jgi:hypothetical protein
MTDATKLQANLTAWLHNASAVEMSVVLETIASELTARHWPTASACLLASTELRRFVVARAHRETERI